MAVEWNATGNQDLANIFFTDFIETETAGEANDTPAWLKEFVDIYSPYYNPETNKMEYPTQDWTAIIIILVILFILTEVI